MMTAHQTDFRRRIDIILRSVVLVAAFLCVVLPASVSAQSETKREAGIEGRVTQVATATVNSPNRSLIATVLIEDESRKGTAYDKASVSVTTATRLFREADGLQRAATFADLRVGARVRATFSGPALMSYPVRVAAGEIVILGSGAGGENDAATDLPPAARRALDANFLEWRVAVVSDAVRQFLVGRSQAVPPQIIARDFNGDGREDYAVNLWHISAANRRQTIAVLLRERLGRGFTMRKLETVSFNPNQAGTGLYLTGRRKGETIYDYEARRRVRLQNDTVAVINFEKSSWVYLYRAGSFRKVFTGD